MTRASGIGVDKNITHRVVRVIEQEILERYLHILLNLSYKYT
jgi:hypothetical protein